MIIHLIAAARPNFMKIAPLYHALKKEDWAEPIIVHTGQHYDLNMSDAFFKDLELPEPDIHLGIGSGSHAEQTGKVMIAYEKVLMEHRPDLVIVVGDVNSTLACTLAASKIKYPTTFINNGNDNPSSHLIFPVHPRTRKNLENFGLIHVLEKAESIFLAEPINYIRFMNLVFNCRLVITDSGGIQEETTYLGIPCLTMRPNTERPITVAQGTNRLCTVDNLEDFVETVISGKDVKFSVPELWDGHTAERVVQSIKTYMS